MMLYLPERFRKKKKKKRSLSFKIPQHFSVCVTALLLLPDSSSFPSSLSPPAPGQASILLFKFLRLLRRVLCKIHYASKLSRIC